MRIILRKFTIKRICYTTLILFFASYVLSSFFFVYMVSKDFMYPFHEYLPDDVRCYFEKTRSDYLDEEYLKHVLTDDVLIHYTSCHFNIKPAHLCSIEAAAVAYPAKKINVLFNKPLSFCKCQKEVLSQLLLLGNVEFVRIHIEKHLNTTPFKAIIRHFHNSVLNRGMRRYKKVEDVLKLATLYNYGGKIIDIDVIVTNPVTDISKWAIVEQSNDILISSAVLAFSKPKDEIIKMSIESLPIIQDPKDDGFNISKAITHAYKTLCYNKSNKVHNIRIIKQCQELRVLSMNIHTVKYSDPGSPLPETYAYRILDEPSQYYIPDNSLIAEIAKKYCPIVYNFTLYSQSTGMI